MKKPLDLMVESFRGRCSELGVNLGSQEYVLENMRELYQNDAKSAFHSYRVGINCSYVAEVLGYQKEFCLISGTLHDVGKLYVDGELLRKKSKDFSVDDLEEVKKHSIAGYLHLKREGYDDEALVALMHHMGQKINPYPREMMIPEGMGEEKWEEAKNYATLVRIEDQKDALFRQNGRYGPGKLDKSQRGRLLKMNNSEHDLMQRMESASPS